VLARREIREVASARRCDLSPFDFRLEIGLSHRSKIDHQGAEPFLLDELLDEGKLSAFRVQRTKDNDVLWIWAAATHGTPLFLRICLSKLEYLAGWMPVHSTDGSLLYRLGILSQT